MHKLEKNTTINDRYVLQTQIGKGGFSEVWKAIDAITETEVAIKIFATQDGLDSDGVKIFRNEYKKVHDLLHSNILVAKHFDVYKNLPFLVMPYCQGSLYSLIADEHQFTEYELAEIVWQIGKALAYLHKQEQKLLHQDIKPHNILIYSTKKNTKKYVLADFGVSSRLRQTIAQSAVGKNRDSVYFTPLYSPPEMYLPSLPEPEKDDIFAFGITLYELACGKLPMMNFVRIVKEKYPIPTIPKRFSSDLEKLIFKCLARERSARPRAETLVEWSSFFIENGYWRIPEAEPDGEDYRETQAMNLPDYVKNLGKEKKPELDSDIPSNDANVHRNTEYILEKQMPVEDERRHTNFIYDEPPQEKPPIVDNRKNSQEDFVKRELPPLRQQEEEQKKAVFEEEKTPFPYQEQQERLKHEVRERVEQGKDSLKNFADSVEDLYKNRNQKKKTSRWRFILPIAVLLVAGTALYWGVSTYEAPNIWGDEEIKTQVPEKWHTLLETYYKNLGNNLKGFQLYATSNTGQYWRELKVMSNDGESSKMILACMLCNPKNSTQQKKGSLHILANTGDKLETVSRSFPMRFSHCDIVNKEQGVTKLPCEKPLDYNKEWEYLKIGNTLIYKYGVETSHCFTD